MLNVAIVGIDGAGKTSLARALAERSAVHGRSPVVVKSRRKTLEHVVTDLFPQGGDVGQASFWCGLRPMTPDGTPIVGGTPYANLYLGTGHGTLGWTMAAGTGRLLADLISGRKPEIALDSLTMARYPRAFTGLRVN